MPEPAVAEPGLWNDLQPVLDQELSRLPEKYRTAIVLCELGGQTLKEAAGQIGCPEGTVASRLARGRAILAKRLTRPGFAVSSAALAAELSHGAASAGVPATALLSTLKAVTLMAAGQALTASASSADVAGLTERVLKSMLLNKFKMVALVLCGLIAIGFGGGWYLHSVEAQSDATGKPPAVAETGKKAAEAAENNDSEKLRGTWRVVSVETDGKKLDATELANLKWIIAAEMITWSDGNTFLYKLKSDCETGTTRPGFPGTQDRNHRGDLRPESRRPQGLHRQTQAPHRLCNPSGFETPALYAEARCRCREEAAGATGRRTARSSRSSRRGGRSDARARSAQCAVGRQLAAESARGSSACVAAGRSL